VAGRFPLLTDADIHGALIKGLVRQGWDVLRAVDVFPGNTKDEILFEYAAKKGRAMATNDKGIHRIGKEWMQEGRSFRMIFWEKQHHRRMTVGQFIEAFEELAAQENPFIYPIVYITPKPSQVNLKATGARCLYTVDHRPFSRPRCSPV